MDKNFTSILFSDKIWMIAVECAPTPTSNNLLPGFEGEIHTHDISSSQLHEIEYLIVNISLFEPQACGDYTPWINNSLQYIKESNIFPNLKSVYVLYDNAKVSFSEIKDHYPVYGNRTRSFLLRSDGTEEKASIYGCSINSNRWVDFNNKKAIFMIGDVSNRPHKFPLLYKFHCENTMDYLDYSLTHLLNLGHQSITFNHDFFDAVVGTLNKIYDTTFDLNDLEKLYYQFYREFPGDRFAELNKSPLESLKHPFNFATYIFPPQWDITSLVLLAETSWRHPVPEETRYPEDANIMSTTEKAWKALITKKPFISISEGDVLDKTLESLGFRTFRKYTSRPDFIDLNEHADDIKEHINVTHERVISFIDNLEQNKHAIWEDVEYNYVRWKLVLEQEWNQLFQNCPPLKNEPREKILKTFAWPIYPDINTNPRPIP